MKAIIVDKKEFAEKVEAELSPRLEKIKIVDEKSLSDCSAKDVADSIVSILKDFGYPADESACIISLNLKLKGKYRQDQAGVEIIYWLRLNKVFCKVLVYSFCNWDSLLRESTRNTLIASAGCQFFRLPLHIDDLKKYLSDGPEIKIDEAAIKPHLHLEWRLAEFEKQDKHELANKFGAINLALAATQTGELVQSEFEDLRKILMSLRAKSDLSFEEYVLLRGFIDRDIESKTSDKEQKKIYSLLQDFKKAKKRPFKLLLIDDHWNDGGWGEVLRFLFQIKSPFKEGIAKSDHMELHCMNEIGSDDSFTPVFQKLELKLDDGNEELIRWDLVILDLNLRGKVESTKEIAERSGYKMLEWIRKIDASLPVVVLSATEKAQNLKALQHLGINGFVSKHLYGGQSSQEFQQFIDSIEKSASKWYLRNFWFDIIWFKNSQDDLWQDHRIEQIEIVSLLKQCYFEIERNSLAFEKVFDRNAYNYILQHCYTALYEIFYEEVIEGEEQSTGSKAVEMKRLYSQFEGFLYFLKWLRNGVLHSNYQCTVHEGIFAFVGVIIVLMQGGTTHSSDLVRWVLKELGVREQNIPSKPIFSVSDLQALLSIFKYWSIRRRFRVDDVVELSLVNFCKKTENDTIEAFFELSFVNNYIVTANVGNSLILDRCPQRKKILQKIAAAKSGDQKRRRQSIKISRSLLDKLPEQRKRDQSVPAYQVFKIRSFDDQNLSISVEPNYVEVPQMTASTVEPSVSATPPSHFQKIMKQTPDIAQLKDSDIEAKVSLITRTGHAILDLPNGHTGIIYSGLLKERGLSLSAGSLVQLKSIKWNNEKNRFDCEPKEIIDDGNK